MNQMNVKNPRFDLEERFIQFAVEIVSLTNRFPRKYIDLHLTKQLIRSGTSPALNYAESQSAESRKDFIHKLSVALKELRETMVCLKIIQKSEIIKDQTHINQILDECNQLISILVKSIQTAKKPKSL